MSFEANCCSHGGFRARNTLQDNSGGREHRPLIVIPMTAFLLWFASFIGSPGATVSLLPPVPTVIPVAATGDCPITSCGLNGTRITGLALAADVTREIRTVTLPSGELLTLRSSRRLEAPIARHVPIAEAANTGRLSSYP